ncbi:hypothetical protein [Methanoculleus chikugoensis]|uniref:hypothetical protein n=1 Tax=Methanoculleus chikugoensis TaxID=118126 RepID=UPI000A737589|nr:hypothetical protein [Methanoculleus chikugoensis]
MVLEAFPQAGADAYERTNAKAYRNGYRCAGGVSPGRIIYGWEATAWGARTRPERSQSATEAYPETEGWIESSVDDAVRVGDYGECQSVVERRGMRRISSPGRRAGLLQRSNKQTHLPQRSTDNRSAMHVRTPPSS